MLSWGGGVFITILSHLIGVVLGEGVFITIHSHLIGAVLGGGVVEQRAQPVPQGGEVGPGVRGALLTQPRQCQPQAQQTARSDTQQHTSTVGRVHSGRLVYGETAQGGAGWGEVALGWGRVRCGTVGWGCAR